MILQQVWHRFTGDWKSFAVLGIGPALSSMAMSAVLAILALITIGPGIFAMVSAGSPFGGGGPAIYAMLGGAMLFVVVALVVMVVASSLVHGGLMGSIVAYRRGEAASVAGFWVYAKRYFRRFLGLSALICVTVVLLFVVTSPLAAIPVIGMLIVVGLQSMVMVNLALYPGYLMVSEELSLIDAISTGLRVVTRNIREACLGGLVLLGFSLALALAMLINGIPLVGQIAFFALSVLYGPVMLFYFTERFEMLVRPSLGGSARGPA